MLMLSPDIYTILMTWKVVHHHEMAPMPRFPEPFRNNVERTDYCFLLLDSHLGGITTPLS
jgi:hypothetical protein